MGFSQESFRNFCFGKLVGTLLAVIHEQCSFALTPKLPLGAYIKVARQFC